MKIVFVHFGPKLPNYLILNIRRACDFFPKHDVLLLVDRDQKNIVDHENFRIQQVFLHEQYAEIEKQLNHPTDFRDNFWFTSLARLTAICDFVIENNQPVLHIESDVLLAEDFPINKFNEIDRPIAYTILGENSAVASVFWLRSRESAESLKLYIMKSVQADSNTTDMRILGNFQRENSQLVRILASFPHETSLLNTPLPLAVIQDFEYTSNHFEGYFDGADLGQYLFGDDPRNHRGIKYLRRELNTSYLSPRSLNCLYSDDRQFINLKSTTDKKVFSLHLHSKNASVFHPSTSAKEIQSAVNDQRMPEKHVLVVNVFLKAVRISILRRLRNLFKVS